MYFLFEYFIHKYISIRVLHLEETEFVFLNILNNVK